ncbi:MAG: PepSY-associated TM helix domain-containing protein [Acidobacteria bacterium]|nr:PepSY-associated TM helix domain-containing protein [Acidobacteriota bacterium]
MGKRSGSTTFYVWVRDLHLYVGIFLSPFVLIFAISTLLLNHNWGRGDTRNQTVRRALTVNVAEGLDTIEHAKEVMRQAGVSGEIGFVQRLVKENHLSISVMKPGREAKIEVDLQGNTATVEEHQTGFWEALVYLHKSPGPHNTNIRGNWSYTRIWGGLADSAVYSILFLSASGIYLWAVIKAERRIGLLLMAAGTLSFFVVLMALSA